MRLCNKHSPDFVNRPAKVGKVLQPVLKVLVPSLASPSSSDVSKTVDIQTVTDKNSQKPSLNSNYSKTSTLSKPFSIPPAKPAILPPPFVLPP
jgi:hypothetical protein